MNVTLAKHAGFCFGVQRALEMVEDEIAQNRGKIYTLGPIIHNEQVVDDLTKRGVEPIAEDADLSALEPGSIIIRSHGIGRKTMEALMLNDFLIIDATCPFVSKIHKTVMQYSENGYKIIILGDRTHPEVEGIIGWINGDRYEVIETAAQAEAFRAKSDEKICLVAQTTFSHKKFKELVEIIKQKGYYVFALNTICNATEQRQTEAEQIAQEADAMFVIGGKNSSNSRKLFEICKNACENTYFLQTVADLDPSVLQSIDNVGITAGASTPDKIIKEVLSECQK